MLAPRRTYPQLFVGVLITMMLVASCGRSDDTGRGIGPATQEKINSGSDAGLTWTLKSSGAGNVHCLAADIKPRILLKTTLPTDGPDDGIQESAPPSSDGKAAHKGNDDFCVDTPAKLWIVGGSEGVDVTSVLFGVTEGSITSVKIELNDRDSVRVVPKDGAFLATYPLAAYARKVTAYAAARLVATCGRNEGPTEGPKDLSGSFVCLNGDLRVPE